jgi:hypothetical protein
MSHSNKIPKLKGTKAKLVTFFPRAYLFRGLRNQQRFIQYGNMCVDNWLMAFRACLCRLKRNTKNIYSHCRWFSRRRLNVTLFHYVEMNQSKRILFWGFQRIEKFVSFPELFFLCLEMKRYKLIQNFFFHIIGFMEKY